MTMQLILKHSNSLSISFILRMHMESKWIFKIFQSLCTWTYIFIPYVMVSLRIMLMGKPLVLQLAICGITTDIMFSNHWTSVSLLEKRLMERYKFDCNIIPSKKTISHSVNKIEPSLKFLSVANISSIYRGKYKKEIFYYFQVPVSDPTYFLPP